MSDLAVLSRAVVALGAAFGTVACTAATKTAPARAPAAHRIVVQDLHRDAESVPVSEASLCDRLVDDFRADPEGAFPSSWETYPASSLDLAKRQGLFRVVTLDGRRALHVRAFHREVVLGRGVENWDLEEYPFVEWLWRPASEPRAAQTSAELASHGAASVTAVWMIGLPFMVRRLGYMLGSQEPEGKLRGERFGYDKWLAIDSENSGAQAPTGASWHRVRVDLLSDYRQLFERTDSEGPTGLSLTAHAASARGAYFADIRLCRRAPATLPRKEPQEAVP